AIKIINCQHIFKMDAIKINDEYFVNMAGLGFDAHIAHLFANFGKRGLQSYVKLILKEYSKYQPEKYLLKVDGQMIDKQAFLISFANSSQFGNNAHIAPLAEINDGLIDICVLKQFPKWRSIFIAFLLYSKGLLKSKYYEVSKAREIEIVNQKELKAHIDGDPILFNSNVKISIIPESIHILIP
ncbi:MAG: diacylglycerol kinase family lipid kinase, partial [Bacteroidales bacterium]|nr:diacylglycerol kinase family lipid kinase [Bacteroidales bacterium]